MTSGTARLVQADVVVPDASGWTGGARWYLCVLSRIFAVDNRDPTYSATSLKGVLAHPSADAIHCVRWTDSHSSVNDVTLTGCSAWFNGEYTGIYTAPNETWPTDEKKREKLALDGCEGVVAHFLGFSGGTDESDWVGYVAFHFDQERWDLGDRSVRCFTYRSKGGRFTALSRVFAARSRRVEAHEATPNAGRHRGAVLAVIATGLWWFNRSTTIPSTLPNRLDRGFVLER